MCKDLGVLDNKYHYKVDFIIDPSRQKRAELDGQCDDSDDYSDEE